MSYFKLMLLSLLFSHSLFALTLESDGSDLPAIVSVKWLQEHSYESRIVLVDLRTEDAYNKEHIENAVNIPALKSLFDKKFFMPKLDYIQKLLSNAGIDSHSLVIAYDDGGFIFAARFYWILEVLGHNNVALLDVGYGNWDKGSLALSNKPSKISPKEFIPRVDSSKVQTKLHTLLAIGEKTIIDGRKVDAYEGRESSAKRYGHIPTAQNYACTQNYQVTASGNKMRDLQELKSLYKDLPKNKEIILYCDGGAEAALNYIVLKELGYKASVYDGSWLEWGNDNSVPVENPSQK